VEELLLPDELELELEKLPELELEEPLDELPLLELDEPELEEPEFALPPLELEPPEVELLEGLLVLEEDVVVPVDEVEEEPPCVTCWSTAAVADESPLPSDWDASAAAWAWAWAWIWACCSALRLL
jgi:hypothetical protein